jgi:hypothetical protein
MAHGFSLDLFDYFAHIAQAAASLRVANFAGALAGLDTGVDFLDHRTLAGTQPFGPDGSRTVSEAVAHKDLIIVGFFLKHRLSHLRFGESLPAIAGKIDHLTICRAAEKVRRIARGQQADIEHRLEGEAIHLFTFTVASRTAVVFGQIRGAAGFCSRAFSVSNSNRGTTIRHKTLLATLILIGYIFQPPEGEGGFISRDQNRPVFYVQAGRYLRRFREIPAIFNRAANTSLVGAG